jgi:dCTP deaminase
MSLLTHSSIVAEIEAGRLQFEPTLEPDQIREASVDLHLSNTFRIFEKATQVIDITETADYQDYTREVVTDSLIILPHETILGVTREKITMPADLCGWLEGRSRFARLGLLVHISAGLMQPGISNHQVLEITNLSPNPLALKAGVRICQLAFQRCEGQATYSGKFSAQVKP